MSNTINLPSGATVTLKDAATLKQKDRAQIYPLMTSDNVSIAQTAALTNTLLALIVTDWTLDLLIPSIQIDSLGELDIADYDALAEHAEPALVALFPSLAKTVESEQNPKATTASYSD
jgi:hypothetical protein